MQKPNEKENADENANEEIKNQDQENRDGNQETETKIGLKNQKSEKGDDDWKKVDSIVTAAKEAYQSGKSDFKDVVESLIATLQDLLASESGTGELGGLYGGPQMDIPAEQEPAADNQPQ